jgi:hypothetical protein
MVNTSLYLALPPSENIALQSCNSCFFEMLQPFFWSIPQSPLLNFINVDGGQKVYQATDQIFRRRFKVLQVLQG